MSRRAHRIAQAEEGITEVQQVLDRAQVALEVAAKIDDVATETVRKGRRWVKVLIAIAAVGIAAVVVRKLLASSNPEPDTNEYSGGGLA